MSTKLGSDGEMIAEREAAQPESSPFFFFFKVTLLFGKGAFRQETLPVGGAGLLDRTVAELTDAPDRRGEKA